MYLFKYLILRASNLVEFGERKLELYSLLPRSSHLRACKSSAYK